jgi:hypothetical protein
MMDKNGDTKPSTMQALLLLSQFDFNTTMNILGQSPLTATISNYLSGILRENPKKVLDEISYKKLYQKNITLMAKQQLQHELTLIRKKWKISAPSPGTRATIQSLWTRDHSLEYIKAKGYQREECEMKYSAIQLRDRILQLEGYKPKNPLELTAPDAQPVLTHVCDDKRPVYEIESVGSHRLRSKKYQYEVKWVDHDNTTWEPESSFDGFTLCDYWKDKVDEKKGIKDEPIKKITHYKGDDASENGGEDDRYQISAIEDHQRIDGAMFYHVLWEGQVGERTWVTEIQFADDVLLSAYWRTIFFNLPDA